MLSAVLVHSSMSEAHIAMCNSLNKVHSYLAHPLFAPVQVGMRASSDFFCQYSPSLHRLLLLKPPEYNHIFFVIFIVIKSCIIILLMLLLILLTLLEGLDSACCKLTCHSHLPCARGGAPCGMIK